MLPFGGFLATISMTLELKHQDRLISVQLLPEGTMSDSAEPQAPPTPQTSDYYRVQPDLPARFNHPDAWRGGSKPGNPLYRTTNQTYGNKPPTVHEMPTTFNGVSDKFSEAATKYGMFRNHGFNTYIEKSFVTGPDNLITDNDRLNFHRSYNMSGPSDSA
ncbi:piercer of microtubule wall 1 protein isoform X2 [Dendrobates tinctorius]|uniref:piercer of microtubule wall 1 protein isoform X2 n=1 Tax=Dendrobates tinctorius TaxID=92724 RepID=UPI003CC9DCCA